jgi:hypothetical protein
MGFFNQIYFVLFCFPGGIGHSIGYFKHIKNQKRQIRAFTEHLSGDKVTNAI